MFQFKLLDQYEWHSLFIFIFFPFWWLNTHYVTDADHRTGSKLEEFYPLCAKNSFSHEMNLAESGRRRFLLRNRPIIFRANKKLSINSSDQHRTDYANADASPVHEAIPPRSNDGAALLNLLDVNNLNSLQSPPKMFRNRFLNFGRMNSVINSAAESFFKSEIRRRLFVTAVLIVIGRVGYYIPLPGFDRRLIPRDYLSFVTGSVGKLNLINHAYHFRSNLLGFQS